MSETFSDSPIQPTVSFLIVEDHAIVRELVVGKIAEAGIAERLLEANSLAEAKVIIEHHSPQLVISDVVLPDGSAIEWTKTLKHSNPQIKVILLTALDDKPSMMHAISAGADAYIVKLSSIGWLMTAIQEVFHGRRFYDPRVSSDLLADLIAGVPIDCVKDEDLTINCSGLSYREREIVGLMTKGYSNTEIAQVLSISINTVKTHASRIFEQLGITSRRQLLPRFVRLNAD